MVKFCPHELFVNTRADLGPCGRLHDDEAKQKYEEARPSSRKRQFEDEFLYFCNSMLNDVDRKIQKGRQRLALMQKDQPAQTQASKYREQLNNLNGRIKKLVAEAEEAGTRGDVDQAQDLMILCEQLKEERDALVTQYDNMANSKDGDKPLTAPKPPIISNSSPRSYMDDNDNDKSPPSHHSDDDTSSILTGDKKLNAWMQDMGHMPEKQMEVCEVCGAFLIVGDAQQRIEDHLMGKQHLGYSKLRKAVEEIHEQRQKGRELDDRKRRDDRSSSHRSYAGDTDRRR